MFKGRLFKWFAGIAGQVVIVFLTVIITQRVTEKSPDVIVRQYFNAVDATAGVPNRVGELALDYRQPISEGQGVYIIEVANKGRAPEEDLRLQAQFPAKQTLSFSKAPDLRVYDAEPLKLDTDGFFMALKNFPEDALASISFIPPEDRKALCQIQIKAAGKSKEGRVKAIEGIECE